MCYYTTVHNSNNLLLYQDTDKATPSLSYYHIVMSKRLRDAAFCQHATMMVPTDATAKTTTTRSAPAPARSWSCAAAKRRQLSCCGVKEMTTAHRSERMSRLQRQKALSLQMNFGASRNHNGGFVQFQAAHPSLCDSKTGCAMASGGAGGGGKLPMMTAMSQPCMPVANIGPTRILPFIYLGSQQDALSKEIASQYGFTYVLNVSTTCPRPAHIQKAHFLRIPVNDNYCDKLSPFFEDAFQFLEKVREGNGCALVHCLAGISRSPTLAIAYVMQHLGLSTDEAYKYVKEKRPTISPNFNFLGQLLEHDRRLQSERAVNAAPVTAPACVPTAPPYPSPGTNCAATPAANVQKKQRTTAATRPCLRRLIRSWQVVPPFVQSPTSALAQLNFNAPSPVVEERPAFPLFPTTSLDKLSFTACLASDECTTKAGVKRSSDSLSRGDATPKTEQEETETSGADDVVTCQVTLRSPGAKRPLVRPNSIAFSSYPALTMSDNPQPRVTTSSSKEDANNQPGCRNSFEAGRKSRSLEDILAADEPLADVLSPDCLRCRASTDPHQSSSSISSNGSHGSIHGSLELITVS